MQAQQGKTDECRSVTPSFRRVADTALQIVLSFEQNGGVNAQLGPVHRQERLHMSVTKIFCGGALCMVSWGGQKPGNPDFWAHLTVVSAWYYFPIFLAVLETRGKTKMTSCNNVGLYDVGLFFFLKTP